MDQEPLDRAALLAAASDLAAVLMSGRAIGVEPPPDYRDELARLRQIMRTFWITRVADLTGLDVIGIPVWSAMRPNSRSLSVSQGKGMVAGLAELGAIMEAIEGAIAERDEPLIDAVGSPSALPPGTSLAPLRTLSRVRYRDFDAEKDRAWVEGISLRTGARYAFPYELVGLDMRVDAPWDHRAFTMSSVGLAAGFDLVSATLHALLEVVENDASSGIDLFGPMLPFARPLRYLPGESEALDAAMAHLMRAGVGAAFFDCTRISGLPTVAAFIEWRNDAGGYRWCGGFACRHDPFAAARDALLEAVQARLTNISGAREDIRPEEYTASAPRPMKIPAAAPSIGSLVPADPVPQSVGEKLADTLARAYRSGVDDVYLVPLAREHGLWVVRVLAANLGAVSQSADRPVVYPLPPLGPHAT